MFWYLFPASIQRPLTTIRNQTVQTRATNTQLYSIKSLETKGSSLQLFLKYLKSTLKCALIIEYWSIYKDIHDRLTVLKTWQETCTIIAIACTKDSYYYKSSLLDCVENGLYKLFYLREHIISHLVEQYCIYL